MKKQTVNFGTAIEALKQGLRVAREGWNGKGMFIFQRPEDTLTTGFIPNVKSLPQSVKDWVDQNMDDKTNPGEQDLTPVKFTSYLCMKAADNTIVNGWLASQTDMLADDWIILDEGFVSQHEKDMTSFGEYLLSDERRKSFEAAYNSEDNISLEERLAGVYHADFENWKTKQN